MSLRSPIGRVLGRGSAKSGVSHWWVQRLTAVALVPLVSRFVCAVFSYFGGSQYAFVHGSMIKSFTVL